jgi:hypothetical protein
VRSSVKARIQPGSVTPEELVRATPSADIVLLPKRRCLAIDGQGSPHAPAFEQAVGALFGTAYALKFARKRVGKDDFKVGPLESHWAANVPAGTAGRPAPETWRWRLRIGVPHDVTKAELDRIKTEVVAKPKGKLFSSPVVPHLFLESIAPQRLGRVLHLGPYDREAESFDLIASVLSRAKLKSAPTHLEVYLNDPSRTRPSGLRTVLLRELAA